jgi:hypothetical protein
MRVLFLMVSYFIMYFIVLTKLMVMHAVNFNQIYSVSQTNFLSSFFIFHLLIILCRNFDVIITIISSTHSENFHFHVELKYSYCNISKL